MSKLPAMPRVARKPRAALWIASRRYAGYLDEVDGGRWAFNFDAQPSPPETINAAWIGLSVAADHSFTLGRARCVLPLRDFEHLPGEKRILFGRGIPDGWGERLHQTSDTLWVRISGPVLEGCRLLGEIEALSPFKLLAIVDDPERRLVPAARIVMDGWTKSGNLGSIVAQVSAIERSESETVAYVNVIGQTSTEKAAHWALAVSPTFTAHGVWTLGFKADKLKDWLTVSQVVDRNDLAMVYRLRRDANVFFGRRPDAVDLASWTDPLDQSAIVLLARLGQKPVASARLVLNGGNPNLSEMAQIVHLPEFLWQQGFAEVSRMVVHPDYQGLSVRIVLFREVARLALMSDSRYLLFDAIPKLASLYEKIGAIDLQLQKKHQDSDEIETLMYLDIRALMRQLDLRAVYLLVKFGRMLVRYARVQGADGLELDGARPNGLIGLCVRAAAWLPLF
ncbi:N-acyl amino acid synthase FeeM domain-containing protein [Bradyrhizobium sp. STM 3562]|uniref:N-acyl amino acid synthase FeeM domain-containing protein n=1 Tax=Bradyrhizobium sp. STM 3562 TaxID=578924 RepID=UPI00388FBD48